MKKFLKNLTGIGIFVAIVFAGGQEPDGGMDWHWTLTCLAITVVLGIIYSFLIEDEEKKPEINEVKQENK